MSLSGVILEEAERVIKDVIQQDNLLPQHHKHLQPDEWGIDLADYFECVAGEIACKLYKHCFSLELLESGKSSPAVLFVSMHMSVVSSP